MHPFSNLMYNVVTSCVADRDKKLSIGSLTVLISLNVFSARFTHDALKPSSILTSSVFPFASWNGDLNSGVSGIL